ncbi:hypothetical protein MMC11_004303 [Xylographa trunciseda]|nr:hypothetical protein [Xylographa trunciseda]
MASTKKSQLQKRCRAGRRHSLIATLIASSNKRLYRKLDKIVQLLEINVSAAALKKDDKKASKAAGLTTSRTSTIDWNQISALTTPSLLPIETTSTEGYSQSQSLLMRLPQEMRNKIYEFVLVSSSPIIEPRDQLSEHRDDATSRIGDINSSLLMSCRRICREAMPILYGTLNTFQFGSPNLIGDFNSRGRRHADFIGRIRLVFDRPYPRNFKGRAAAAKSWVNELFSIFNDSTMALPGLRELELDFASWGMQTGDAFPLSLIKGLKKRGWKVKKLVLRGLEHQPVPRELLEQTLLETPPSRLLTNEDDQVLETAGSTSAM